MILIISFSKLTDLLVKNLNEFLNIIIRILLILDSDIRRDIYIGITGLMIAIIIFIADTISKQKYELEKRLILEKTKIIKRMLNCIIIYITMYLASLIRYSNNIPQDGIQFSNKILYLILQFILNFMILTFSYKTFNVFRISVKLNTDREYLNKELVNFINRKAKNATHIYKIKNENQEKAKKDFENYIINSKFCTDNSSEVSILNNEYVPIYSSEKGIIKKYNYKKINSIINNIQKNNYREVKEQLPNNKKGLALIKGIGEKVGYNNIIGYCLKRYQQYFQDSSSYIVYSYKNLYRDDEIKLINKDLFEMASNYNNAEKFDDNRIILNFIEYQYQNELITTKSITINQIGETAEIFNRDYETCEKYISFLYTASFISLNYNNIDDYKYIDRIINKLYSNQIYSNVTIVKDVVYKYCNNYFLNNYYLFKNNDKVSYYDITMANLLRMIINLIRTKQYDAIDIIIKNIRFNDNNYSFNFLNEKEILNFQFTIGIVFVLIMDLKRNELNDNNKETINKLIDWSDNLINIYDAWQVIINFKKYFHKHSEIQNVYSYLDIDFIEHKYENSWGGIAYDEMDILKNYLTAFKIQYINTDDIDKNEITKDDKFYFENLQKLFLSKKECIFEEKLNYIFNQTQFTQLFDIVIECATEKEEEFKKKSKTNINKIKKFTNKIREESCKTGEFEEYLIKQNKVEKSNATIKTVYGIYELIPRELFFKESPDIQHIAIEYGSIFLKGKEEEFVNIIDNLSEKVDEDVNNYINSLENLEDYLLITNHLNYIDLKNYNNREKSIIINEKKLDVITISKVNCFYIMKKKDLPTLQYCNFINSYNTKYIKNHLYCEIEDCAENVDLRSQIIDNSDWLSEKGSIEHQHEYLKSKCTLKLFMAFRYKVEKNVKVYKFNTNKNSKDL